MSIQQNFPAISPSLSLNFARSKTLDPRITFTRTSLGTRTNATGLIEVVPANSPRFDYSYDPVSGSVRSLGLLIEEGRSNLITYSEDFDTWTKPGTPAGASISQDATISPDGSNTADKIVESNTTGGHSIWKGFTLPQTTTYTFSVFLKADERTWVDVRAYNPTNGNQFIAKIDLENGDFLSNTIGGPVRLDQYPDGWWRFSGECSFDNIYTQFFIAPIISNNNTSDTSYTGDGTSGIYVWGAQLEVGSFPTSYIPTTNSTVTRTADNVSMVGENFSSWYNQDEGTIYVSQKLKSIDTVDRNGLVYLINGGSGSDIFYNVKEGDTNIFVFGDNGTNYSRWQENGDSTDTKAIWAYDVSGDDFKPYWNGIEGINESIPNTPSATSHTQLEIGATVGANKYNGHIAQLTYYPRRLTNSNLQNLTK
jgi:hypothetical protein